MFAQRDDEQQQALVRPPTSSLVSSEVLRNSARYGPTPEQSQKSEDRLPLFWRVFGGTLLSIAALICLTVYQQFNNALYDLRKELNSQHEARADLVKKDELNNRMTVVWTGLKDLQTAQAELPALKERCAMLQEQLKSVENDRKQLATEVQQLRERLLLLEGRLTAPATVKTQ